MDNSSKEYISYFSHFNQKFSPGNRLINTFSNQFSFHYYPHNINNYIKNLDNMVIKISLIPTSSIVVLDTSIKNSVVISISHIHLYNKPIIKTIHWAINVTTTKAKLFAIRCGINQAINTPNVKHIIIITDSIHATERIFDSSPYLYQTHSAAIFKRLWEFFKVSVNNHINFWDCSSKVNWPLYAAVDCDTKKFVAFLSFPCKSSWDFCKSYRDKFVLNS